MSAALEALRKARDEAQREYAWARQYLVVGNGSEAVLSRARAAYLAAQGEYRAARLDERARGAK